MSKYRKCHHASAKNTFAHVLSVWIIASSVRPPSRCRAFDGTVRTTFPGLLVSCTQLRSSFSNNLAVVYIVLEAHHRFDNDTVVEDLWSLIGKVYVHHSALMRAISRPDIASIARITLVAWQRRHTYLQQRGRTIDLLNQSEVPSWIQELRQKLEPLDFVNPMPASDATAQQPTVDDNGQILPPDFNFDVIDWAFWENSHLNATFEPL